MSATASLSSSDAAGPGSSADAATPGDDSTRKKPGCRHCGAGLADERLRASGFCCAGCRYVYQLVHAQGLGGYYRIKDEVTAPADAAVFQARDYGWLERAQREAEAAEGTVPALTVEVQGISCAGCVWLIDRVFQQRPGARDVHVNAQYGTMRLTWVRGEFSAVEFGRKLQALGYLTGPAGETPAEPESRALVRRIGLCAAFAMNVMLFSLPTYFGMERDYEWARLFGVLNVVFGTLSLMVGGVYFLGRAARALRERAMHIDLPISLGIVGAYSGSLYGWIAGEERYVYFDFVSAFILSMLVGRWAQVAAIERNRRRLLSRQPKPQRVRLVEGGDAEPEHLRAGRGVLLSVGQTLPVESRLEEKEATFSLASINGEAAPRVFRAGRRVPAGAVNIGRTELRLTTLQGWDESLLARLWRPAERRGGREVFLERIVRAYLTGILGVAGVSGVAWWLMTGDALRTGAVVTAVLVVSCPCAIALAFPLVDEIATIALRRRGVFVREGDLWGKLSRVRKVVFDKTGTLTLETPVLENPEAVDALDPTAREALFLLVRDNPHPISQCVFEHLLATGERPERNDAGAKTGVGAADRDHGTTTDASESCNLIRYTRAARVAGEVREAVGLGVEIDLDGRRWTLGRPGWRTGGDGPSDDSKTDAAEKEWCNLIGYTMPGAGEAELACEGGVVARLRFLDTARPDAREELAALEARGLAVFVLSGDRREKVSALARELGLPQDRATGEMTPEGKARWLETRGAGDAMMLGDGANDSLAFDRAWCRGTPVIHRGGLEHKADFYYLGRGIGGLRAMFEVDVVRRRARRAILVFSVAYNLFAVGLAVAGRMNPLVAAALMPINSLLTLAIAMAGMRRLI